MCGGRCDCGGTCARSVSTAPAAADGRWSVLAYTGAVELSSNDFRERGVTDEALPAVIQRALALGHDSVYVTSVDG